MQLKHLFTEDRAVSSVTGAILMVAITAIFAAAIRMFVLGLGDQVSETSPQASSSFDYDGTDNLTIIHESGEQIAADQATITGNFSNSGNSWTSYGGSDPITTDGSVVVNNSGGFADGDTVRVVWNLQSGSMSSTFRQWAYNGQMNFKHLLAEDDAVSSVIGVILMVAITVILAAVIGTFVLGPGDQVDNTAPQASPGFDYDGTALTVTHGSGTSIDATQVNITFSVAPNGSVGQLAGASGATETWESITSDSEITAGSQATVAEQNADNLSIATVRVIWTSESDSNSATLQSWSGPDV